MGWEKREILLIAKTYPSRSKKYGNTVCTAGILEDTNEWVRLYPIRWERYLSSLSVNNLEVIYRVYQ